MIHSRCRFAAATVLAAALVAGGCVSKGELEKVRSELEACQQEKASLSEEVAAWEARFDRAAERWTNIESSVVESVPNALAEFDAERDRILELVPEQVQYEVASYLDDYFGTLMSAFRGVQGDNRDIKLQLDATQKALSALDKDTRQISAAIEEAVTLEADKRRAVADGLAVIHRQLVDFARERINCADCEERIKLNKREREAVLGFHAELMSALSNLQTEISG